MIPTASNPCLLYWRGPPTDDPTEQGEVAIGISTDDNLEIVKPNQASRNHLQVIRQAYADNEIESVAEDNPDQIIGIAIAYGPTSNALTCPMQIHDLINLFFPNDEHIPPTYTPAPTYKNRKILPSPHGFD